jgi:hypothetical protein
MRAMTATARLSEDRSRFTLAAGGWSGTFPVDQLDAQLSFYRGLRDRKGGRYAAFYEPTVVALEALATDLGSPPAQNDKPRHLSPPLTVSRPPRPAAHTAGHGDSQFSLGL